MNNAPENLRANVDVPHTRNPSGSGPRILVVEDNEAIRELNVQVLAHSGYQVDDASITAQVKVALLLHRSTSSVGTTVATTDGVVTVSGIAKNAAEKTLVTKLATDITGVKSVVNHMTIAPAVSTSQVEPARPSQPRG